MVNERQDAEDQLLARWRDDMLWLLSGIGKLLDIRTFYYHLREECSANPDRVRMVKRHLRAMNRQVYELQESLKYCSPLGSILHAIRRTHGKRTGSVIGIQSIRTLEDAGISRVGQLAELGEEELVAFGVKRRFARQVVRYLRQRGQ